jgi:hypothetical protein
MPIFRGSLKITLKGKFIFPQVHSRITGIGGKTY